MIEEAFAAMSMSVVSICADQCLCRRGLVPSHAVSAVTRPPTLVHTARLLLPLFSCSPFPFVSSPYSLKEVYVSICGPCSVWTSLVTAVSLSALPPRSRAYPPRYLPWISYLAVSPSKQYLPVSRSIPWHTDIVKKIVQTTRDGRERDRIVGSRRKQTGNAASRRSRRCARNCRAWS